MTLCSRKAGDFEQLSLVLSVIYIRLAFQRKHIPAVECFLLFANNIINTEVN